MTTFHQRKVASRERLRRDLKHILEETNEQYKILCHRNIYCWIVQVKGPVGSAYEGIKIPVILKFPYSYPLVGPKIRMGRSVFHPNVDPVSRVFWIQGLMRGNWRSENDVHDVIMIMLTALVEPSTFHVVNKQALKLLGNRKKYREMVFDVFLTRSRWICSIRH